MSTGTLICVCIFFLLFDNYITPPGIRVFDFFGSGLLIYLAVSGNLKLISNRKDEILGWTAAIFMVISVIQGVLIQNSLAFIPFILGLTVYFLLKKSLLFTANIKKILKIMLILSTLVIFVQYVIYLSTGVIYSLVIFDDGFGLRSNFAGLLHRPTGLFIEPGSHATAVIILIFLYMMLIRRLDWIILFSIAGVFVSQSLFGVVIVIVMGLAYLLFGIRKLSDDRRGRLNLLIFFVIPVIILMFSLSFEGTSFDRTIFQRMDLLKNTASIAKSPDGSFNDRLGGLMGDGLNRFLTENSPLSVIFGKGLSTDHFQEIWGANTLGWLITSFGLAGAFFILLFIFSLVEYSVFGIIFICVMLIPFPLASYMFLWMALAILSLLKRRNIESNVS